MSRLGAQPNPRGPRRPPPTQTRRAPKFLPGEREVCRDIGAVLHAKRTHDDMSLRDLGKLLCVGASTLSRMEHGDFPSAVSLLRVLGYLGISIQDEVRTSPVVAIAINCTKDKK